MGHKEVRKEIQTVSVGLEQESLTAYHTMKVRPRLLPLLLLLILMELKLGELLVIGLVVFSF